MVLWFCVHYISTTATFMATKPGRMMSYLEWLLLIKSHDHIITWSCKITRQTKIIIYPLTQCLWLSILAGWGYTMSGCFHKVTRFFDRVVLQGQVKYFSCCITTTTGSIATKLGKVVTYYKKLQPVKSRNPLRTWSRKVIK